LQNLKTNHTAAKQEKPLPWRKKKHEPTVYTQSSKHTH